MIDIEQLEKWNLTTLGGGFGFDFSDDFQKGGKKEVIVKCTDNCSCMSVDKFNDEEEYYITFYKSNCNGFWQRLKVAFLYLFKGDRIDMAELVLSEEDYNKLREF